MKVTNAAPTRFLHLGIRRLDHEVLVHRLVEQSIGLVVHSMHWIMHDVVEGQERPAAQLLRHVLLRVTVLLPRTVLVLQGEELLVDRIEGCLAPMWSVPNSAGQHGHLKYQYAGSFWPSASQAAQCARWHRSANVVLP